MPIDQIPLALREKYRFAEWLHATAILASDFPEEWDELLRCLASFTLKQCAILAAGGGRSQIPIELDGCLNARGWEERAFDIDIVVDGQSRDSPTHKIDNFKNWIALELGWSNKDHSTTANLNTERLLFDL